MLAATEPDDAATFLNETPARIGARALSRMSAWSAASVLARMTTVAAAAVVRELHYQEATAALRLLPADARQALIAELPERLREDFALSLAFPDDTVGAFMNTAILSLKPEQTVGDALSAVRRSPAQEIATVFTVDDERRLVGMARVSALLPYDRDVLLTRVVQPCDKPLSTRARIVAVAEQVVWDDFAELPVVSRQGQLVGSLSRGTVRQALGRPSGAVRLPVATGGTSLAQALGATVAGLLGLLSGRRRAIVEERREHG